MKKEELLQVQAGLYEIKKIADKESYLISSAINNQYIKIEPIIKQELERMDSQGVEINCPKIKTVYRPDNTNITIEQFDDYINEILESLVSQGYKIIDYGYLNEENVLVIKYTD